jgi:hypothetical protein
MMTAVKVAGPVTSDKRLGSSKLAMMDSRHGDTERDKLGIK